MSMTFHLMTSSLVPGDAISNHVITVRRLLAEMGFRVVLYADHVAPRYRSQVHPSTDYRATGQDVLWFYYSIYAKNMALAELSTDYKVMDFRGITPPHLFAGYDPRLEQLCQRGYEALASHQEHFDLCVVHSEYSRQVLQDYGYAHIIKLPNIIDTDRYGEHRDEALAAWLSRLPYLFFAGRIVPQKDILALLDLFAHLRSQRPDVALLLAGRRDMAPDYQRQIDQKVHQLGLDHCTLFTGQVNNPGMLASLFQHAKFTIITSEWESFCVPVAESMFFETPVIVHRVPPLPEVAGEAGVVIDKHHPQAAVEQIEAVWADTNAYERLQQACRHRAPNFTTQALRVGLRQILCRLFT